MRLALLILVSLAAGFAPATFTTGPGWGVGGERGVGSPMSAGSSRRLPGNSTCSFFEGTWARAPAVRSPHTRFSEEAEIQAAGPAEYVFTSLIVRFAVG